MMLCTLAFKFNFVHFRYTEAVESVTAEFLKRVNNLNKKNVFVIKGMEKDKQLFDSKKVHLTPEAGYDYLVQLLGEAETAFETEMEVVEEESEEAEDRMEVVVVPEAEKAKKLQDDQVLWLKQAEAKEACKSKLMTSWLISRKEGTMTAWCWRG